MKSTSRPLDDKETHRDRRINTAEEKIVFHVLNLMMRTRRHIPTTYIRHCKEVTSFSHTADRTSSPVQLTVQSVDTIRVGESAFSTTGFFIISCRLIGERIDGGLRRRIKTRGPREPTWFDFPLPILSDPLSARESLRSAPSVRQRVCPDEQTPKTVAKNDNTATSRVPRKFGEKSAAFSGSYRKSFTQFEFLSPLFLLHFRFLSLCSKLVTS